MGRVAEEEGVDLLGVSCLEEGRALRRAGIRGPILVFGAIHEDQMEPLLFEGLECSISSLYKARFVEKIASQLKKRCTVHLEVDTGIHRTGVRPETAFEVFDFLRGSPWFQVKGIYSHFATADTPDDPFAYQQIERFTRFKEALYARGNIPPGVLWHIANSGGTLYYPSSHFDMARPGFLTYGGIPSLTKPCFSLKARVSYFKVVEEGEGISYGHLYRTKAKTRVVTIPLGYGDGYRRAFSNRAPVLIRGKRYTVSGAVCMDQCMVDIGQGEAYVGDEVTLLGKQGDEEITIQELAQIAGTIPYELLCSLTQRLPRKYVS